MNSIIFLITLLAIYYYIYQITMIHFEEKYHYYFYIFIGVYTVILYIYYFEYELFYKLLKNIYDTNKQPLYEFNTINSNAELFSTQDPFIGFNIKETLLNKQGGRCYACSNFIMNSDLQHSKLKYKRDLKMVVKTILKI